MDIFLSHTHSDPPVLAVQWIVGPSLAYVNVEASIVVTLSMVPYIIHTICSLFFLD
jgi:hypothetical protein